MRLFGYYAWHSFVNQVKKLCKTWVLIFIVVCVLIGGLIGVGAAKLSKVAEEKNAEEQVEEPEDEGPSFFEREGVDRAAFLELLAGGAVLFVLAFEALNADKSGSKIFLPADVPLLFTSPMKPQSVLMFRLMTQLGMAVFAGLYMLLQLPNLIYNAGMGLWGALAAIGTFCLLLVVGKFMQVLLYLLCSARPWLKHNLRRIVYALLGLLFVAFLYVWKSKGGGWIAAATDFFCAPGTRYVPVWGWLKGLYAFAAEENALGALTCLALDAATIALLGWASGRVKADFYEDAMAKSEETAELLEAVQRQQEGGTAFRKRKKDRSERLRRDTMKRGAGANVFFFKSLYNRFRFAHLGIFTKTTETYLAAALGVWALCRYVMETDPTLPVVLTLAVFAFYRALGNPLDEDTKMAFFVLIPESVWSKLMYSLLGGTVNCALDVLPALVVGAILTGMNPLLIPAWLLFIVSVDFYSTTVGVFIALSVPVAAGKMVKQFAQVLFVYFGLLPDIAILAIGIVAGYTAVAAIGAALLNVVLGLVFFALSPQFLEPGGSTGESL